MLIYENEPIVADAVLLSSSRFDGLTFIDTSSIDGETDLKPRRSIKETQNMPLEEICFVECLPPNDEIYKFDSTITIKGNTYSLSSRQLLLQGTVLKNTDVATALVVYTGNETKIGKNKQKLEIKWTRADEFVNALVIFIFCFQLCLMLFFGTIGNFIRFVFQDERVFYLGYAPIKWYEFIIIPTRYLYYFIFIKTFMFFTNTSKFKNNSRYL